MSLQYNPLDLYSKNKGEITVLEKEVDGINKLLKKKANLTTTTVIETQLIGLKTTLAGKVDGHQLTAVENTIKKMEADVFKKATQSRVSQLETNLHNEEKNRVNETAKINTKLISHANGLKDHNTRILANVSVLNKLSQTKCDRTEMKKAVQDLKSNHAGKIGKLNEKLGYHTNDIKNLSSMQKTHHNELADHNNKLSKLNEENKALSNRVNRLEKQMSHLVKSSIKLFQATSNQVSELKV
jgi:chromosome segregation ATPase